VASAKIFMDRDYAETKDLAKAFLTLLTAVFFGSVTFSEKIVNLNQSEWTSKALMILCWCLLLLAIASCGAGLALMATAAGFATYEPDFDYRQFERSSLSLFIVGILTMVFGDTTEGVPTPLPGITIGAYQASSYSLFVIARDSEFSPGQHTAPRQLSFTAQLRF
jgi:hypothetical protein